MKCDPQLASLKLLPNKQPAAFWNMHGRLPLNETIGSLENTYLQSMVLSLFPAIALSVKPSSINNLTCPCTTTVSKNKCQRSPPTCMLVELTLLFLFWRHNLPISFFGKRVHGIVQNHNWQGIRLTLKLSSSIVAVEIGCLQKQRRCLSVDILGDFSRKSNDFAHTYVCLAR